MTDWRWTEKNSSSAALDEQRSYFCRSEGDKQSDSRTQFFPLSSAIEKMECFILSSAEPS